MRFSVSCKEFMIRKTRDAPRIAHILIYALFFLILTILPQIVSNAEEPNPSAYHLKEVSEEDIEGIIFKNDMTVYFYDSDGSIRMGEAFDVFRYLKAKNKNEINVQYSLKWGMINSQLDRLDSISFYAEANLGNGCILNYLIDNIGGNVMQFTDGELTYITRYYDYFVPIFIVLLILFIMKSLAELVEHNKASMEAIGRIFILGLIAAFFIAKSDKLLTLFFAFSNSFLNLVSDIIRPERISAVSAYSYDDIVKIAMACDGNSAWDSINRVSNAILHVFWGQILMFLVIILLTIMTYSVKLKFALRGLFLPFAMTSLPYKGKQSAAVRYLKKMGACALLAGTYTVILSFGLFYNSAMSGTGTGLNSLAETFIMPFVILLSMKTAEMISEEVANTI